MPLTVYDVVSGTRIRLGAANIPSTLSDGSMADLATDRLNDIAQVTGLSIDSGNIPTRFMSPLKDLTCADVIATRDNTDIDTEVSIGNLRLNYSNKNAANARQIQYFLDRAQMALRMQGQRITHTYTTKGV